MATARALGSAAEHGGKLALYARALGAAAERASASLQKTASA